MNIKDFYDLYNEYLNADIELSDDYMDKINLHFMAYLKNPTDKQADTFKTIVEALIVAFLTDLLKKWEEQLKIASEFGYDFSQTQTEGIDVVSNKIDKNVITNLYKNKLDVAIEEITSVTQGIRINVQNVLKDIQTNLETTKKQISLELMETFNKYGITYFTRADGSKLGISDYVKMKSSDLVISSFRNSYFADLLSKNIELVQVKRLPTQSKECDACKPYDNKVLSLQDKDGFESVSTAKMNGLFHFSCFHYVIPFMDNPTDEDKTITHSEENKRTYARNEKKGIKRKLID